MFEIHFIFNTLLRLIFLIQVPMYLGEISPKHLRGSLGAMNQVLISCTRHFLVSTFCLLACHNSGDEFLRLTLVVSSSCRLLTILYVTLAMIRRPDCNPFSCFNFFCWKYGPAFHNNRHYPLVHPRNVLQLACSCYTRYVSE
jgi:hypothetical protein